jgi:hypothetical protein
MTRRVVKYHNAARARKGAKERREGLLEELHNVCSGEALAVLNGEGEKAKISNFTV